MFIPMTKKEAAERGWNELDIIFVTGDAYIDHPAFGVPLLARWLESRGFKVGIIAQPDWRSKEPFMALGCPRLFFAVSAGAMDSMVAHYTPARKIRRDDAYTPGNVHGARPNRATIIYSSRLKEAYREVPVVIGGIEASLRRFAHYDFWEDKVRRSILFDSKADLLIYGMGERPILELAQRLADGEAISGILDIRGTAVIAKDCIRPAVEVPSYEEVSSDRLKYAMAFMQEAGEFGVSAKAVVQRHGDRLLLCNPPSLILSEKEMDLMYGLPFARSPHFSYSLTIPAYEQIKTSITSHRGCFGGCAFCAITYHQGKVVQSRSETSILAEVKVLVEQKSFRGSISDVGGPSANMYATGCSDAAARASCKKHSCLYPRPCPHLKPSDRRGAELLKRIRAVEGVKSVAVSSGVRYDLIEQQPLYLQQLLAHHVGGLLKVAPEHMVDRVTAVMRKPGGKSFQSFLALFRAESKRLGKKQYIVPYLMSGHPGCTMGDMVELALALKHAGLKVEQVQDFTPTPGTLSTCIYYTGIDPYSGKEVYVPRGDREKMLQKSLLLSHLPAERTRVLAALKACGREAEAENLLGRGTKLQDVRKNKHGSKKH